MVGESYSLVRDPTGNPASFIQSFDQDSQLSEKAHSSIVLEKQQFHCCPLEHRMKNASYDVACSSQCSDNAKYPSGLWNPLVLDPV